MRYARLIVARTEHGVSPSIVYEDRIPEEWKRLPLAALAEKFFVRDNTHQITYYAPSASAADEILPGFGYIDVFTVMDDNNNVLYYMIPLGIGWLILDKTLRVVQNDSADMEFVEEVRKLLREARKKWEDAKYIKPIVLVRLALQYAKHNPPRLIPA